MATNKRKDATALFELIDKSTLKVPKRTGSLKIPSWWSSKTNPPGAATNGAGGADAADSSRASTPGAAVAKSSASQTTPIPIAQRRLYEPPAASADPGASPSIRPPVPVAPLSAGQAAVLDNTRVQALSGAEAPPSPTDSAGGAVNPRADGGSAAAPAKGFAAADKPELREGYAGTGTGRRIFAPQTMNQNGQMPAEWALAQKFRLARTPTWMLVSGAAIVAVIVFGLIFLVARPRAGGPRSAEANLSAGPENDGAARLVPGIPEAAPPATAARPGPVKGLLEPVKEPIPAPKPAQAQWFAPGAVTRSPALYYIVIATSPSEKISQRNAVLLAEHGVSVSIELLRAQPLFRLISVEGFKTISDAQPLRKQIVAIGHLVPDYAKTRKGWEDAMVLRGASLPGNVAGN